MQWSIITAIIFDLYSGVIQMTSEPVLVTANGKSFQVHTNPSSSELLKIGPLVRFTANRKDRNVYVWNFNSGHHGDVSIALKLDDTFDSLDF
jgi:hypothetical protein